MKSMVASIRLTQLLYIDGRSRVGRGVDKFLIKICK